MRSYQIGDPVLIRADLKDGQTFGDYNGIVRGMSALVAGKPGKIRDIWLHKTCLFYDVEVDGSVWVMCEEMFEP